jgi:hypothetical protein
MFFSYKIVAKMTGANAIELQLSLKCLLKSILFRNSVEMRKFLDYHNILAQCINSEILMCCRIC